MSEIIQGLLWNSRIGKWFSFGQRWLLLVPFAVVLVVLTVLASSHFELIQEAFGLPSSQEIVTNRYFIIVSVVLVLVGPVSFVVMTRWPPPKNRFAIMVSKFYPITPGSEEQALLLQDQVWEEIDTRMRTAGIAGDVKKVRRENPQEPIDLRNKEGRKRGRLLGRHNRVHIVVGSTVTVAEEVSIKPQILNMVARSGTFSPSDPPASKAPDQEMISFRERETTKVADLATFICGLARINERRYNEATNILSTIAEPSAEVHFYHGLALMEIGEKLDDSEQARPYFEQALSYFENACMQRPNFAFALVYAGFASRKLGKDLTAGYSQLVVEIPSEELLKDSTLRDERLVRDISRKLFARALEDLEDFVGIADEIGLRQEIASNLMAYTRELSDLEMQAVESWAEGEKHLMLAGDYEKAVNSFDQAAQLYARVTELERARATELERLNQSADLEGLDLRTDHTRSGEGNVWSSKALALAKLGRFEEAREAAQKGTELDGDRYTLARAFAALGDKANALANLSVATKDDPYYKERAQRDEEFDQYRGDEKFAELIELRPGESKEGWQRKFSKWETEREEEERNIEQFRTMRDEIREEQERQVQRQARQRSPFLAFTARITMEAKRRVRTNPGSYRFRLGKYDCLSINDGIFNYPVETFFADASTERIDSYLLQHNLPTKQIAAPCSCLFVDTGQHRVLVDTGAGALGYWARALFSSLDHSATVTGRLLENMEAEGIDPLDIDKVVITHAHPNRIGGALDESGEPAFPNADYFLSQDELSFLASDAATMKMLDPTVDELLTNEVRLHLFALRDQLTRFDGDYEIVPGIKAIVAPGHTPGHVVLSVGSDGEQLLHVSDVLLHPLHLKHPEWTPVFDTSPEEAAASKRWVFDRAAEEGALVFANHLPPFPNLGHIVKGGEGWQWYPIENRG